MKEKLGPTAKEAAENLQKLGQYGISISDINITFPAVLKSERNRLGWTRTKMSEITGIPYGTLESWERGVEPAAYIKRYVLAGLREKGRSASKFFDMVDILTECESFIGSCPDNADGYNLYQKIKAVLYD